MPKIKCKVCKKEFYAKPSHLKRGWSNCCSIKCRTQRQKIGEFVNCEICGKGIWKTPKDFKKSKSGKFFCSKSCQTKWRNVQYSGENHALWQGGEYVYRDLMLNSNNKQICNKCGEKDLRVLVVHHLDKNRKNNDISNLVWLCRNCHHLVHKHNEEIK